MEEKRNPEALDTPKATPVTFLAAHPLFQILRVPGRGLAEHSPPSSQVSPPPARFQGAETVNPKAPVGISEGLTLQERVSPLLSAGPGRHRPTLQDSLPTWATLSVLIPGLLWTATPLSPLASPPKVLGM